MIKAPKVLVVIINYKSTKDLLELLESMKNLTYKNYDILVIDNNSQEDLSLLKKYKVKLIENKENLGFTGAVNQAFKNFRYDYYLLLNPDTIIDKNLLSELIETAEKNNAGFVGSAIYDYTTKKISAIAGKRNFITGLAFPVKNINAIMELNGKDEYVDACSLLVSRQVIEKVGYFDENYFAYLETEDLILRAKKKGFRVFTNPKAIVYHKVYGSSKGNKSKRAVYLLNRNRIYFMKKFTNKSRFALFIVVNTLFVFPLMILVYLIRGHFSLIPAVIRGNFSI
ncbi:glycosyltransferase family 2 protein [Candidatus Woesearchaeota archaeon]|nr:glycosyltransferase family 2 protein [Candidatus Woesearchaeota archaeon]